MKRLLVSSLLVSALLPIACTRKPSPVPAAPASTPEASAVAPSASPDNPGGNPPGGPGGGNFQQRAAERMQRMKTEIGLTDDQAQKIQTITEAQFGSLRQQGNTMSREDRRAAFQKARDAANAEIEQVLTPEQKPKWEAMQQQMQAQRAQRDQGGQGGQRRRQGGGGAGGPQ